MRRRSLYGVLIAGVVLVAAGAGCAVLTDVFNPDTFPAFAAPDPGVVIVALNNDSDFPAVIFAGVSRDSAIATIDYATVNVNANETSNRVYNCPLTLVSAGPPDGGTGALVLGPGGEVFEVAYNGGPILSNDFSCGDVIEIRLIQNGNGAEAEDYALQLIVRPGR